MNKFIFLIFAIALAMFTTGCTASYQHMTLNQPANELYPQSRFLLVTPVNGMYGNTVYPSSGFEVIQALTKELQAHVKHETAPYKYPRIIEYVDELPKTISGKIRRVEIRQKDSQK